MMAGTLDLAEMPCCSADGYEPYIVRGASWYLIGTNFTKERGSRRGQCIWLMSRRSTGSI